MKILDFIFPPKCPFCGKILTEALPLCSECADTLPYTGAKTCEICSKPMPDLSYRLCAACHKERRHFKKSFAALVYEDKAQHAVISFKYYFHPYYANAFAYLIADKLLQASDPLMRFDFITFIPQSRKTFLDRGYNQSELIAKKLAKILKLPCKSTLFRTNESTRQATLNASQRRKNVVSSYFLKESDLSGTALLVDDVYTTGATANYCSRLLKKAGCSEVYLAIALIRM